VTHESAENYPNPGGSPAGVFSSPPQPTYRPRWWLHWTLFGLTLASTTFIGALFWGGLPADMATLSLLGLFTDPRFLIAGLKFSIPLLFILFCHEMGHYIACKRHNLIATPPFFIPFPLPVFGIGTLGAVIRIKEPIRDSKQLLDVGAWGPIAGFVALIPCLLYGIASSEITEVDPEGAYLLFGEPLVFRALSWLIYPEIAQDGEMLLHPTGVAAWFGVFITLLNLLPFAQLDGGHISYALFGRWHRKAAVPALLGLVAMGFWWPGWWFWAVIAVIMRVHHPRIWDEDLPLDPKRRLLGWIAVIIFVLCFMIEPIAFVE